MWFRQGTQAVDTDRIRASIKSRMRRFRSPEKATNSTDQTDKVQRPSSAPSLIKKPSIICEDTDDENEIDLRRSAAAAIVQRSPSCKKVHKGDKDKSLLTDRKFKNKRIVKSASKSKMVDGVADSKVRGVSLRKSSAPPVMHTTEQVALDAAEVLTSVPSSVKKHVRSHSNLNLNALLRYKLTNRKLSTADFERLRRKSVTNEATPTTPGVSLDVHQPSNSQASEVGCSSDSTPPAKFVQNPNTDEDEEEVFLSASEDVNTSAGEVVAHKKSPSLGARISARFADTSSSKAKKASKLKKQKKDQKEVVPQPQRDRKSSSGSELFKQNSFGNKMLAFL